MADEAIARLRYLLELPPEADEAQVRRAYERAVNDAVRSSDHRRAVMLSQAFDELPLRQRQNLYSGAGTSARTFDDLASPRRRTRRGSGIVRRAGATVLFLGALAVVLWVVHGWFRPF